MNSERIFISQYGEILTGSNAKAKLEELNDLRYLDSKYGNYKIDWDRWRIAQSAEHQHWFDALGVGKQQNDRNDQHEYNFDNYITLRHREFKNAIEIGCGPFTNLRLIAKHTRIRQLTLLDPSIGSYLDHKYCFFNSRKLFVPRKVTLFGRDNLFERAYERFPKAARRFMRSIPVISLLEQGAEEPFGNNQFDLVVMINVLEHCLDAFKVLTNLVEGTRNGGLVVFSDKIFDVNALRDGLSRVYDAAHPLRISYGLIDEVFRDFRILFKKEIEDEATSKYFPGTKVLTLIAEKVV